MLGRRDELLTLPGFEAFDDGPPRVLDPVYAATEWASNAELVVALRGLGYLEGRVLDPTYGRGTWWAQWEPRDLVRCDLRTGVDVTALPFRAGAFDAAVYDPPHVPHYEPRLSTRAEYRDRYGLTGDGRGSPVVDELYRAGILELGRVVRGGGYLIVKSTDHVNDGKYQPMAARTAGWLAVAGFTVVDVLIMLRPAGPLNQSYAVQRTSWRNYSTATVARRKGRP